LTTEAEVAAEEVVDEAEATAIVVEVEVAEDEDVVVDEDADVDAEESEHLIGIATDAALLDALAASQRVLNVALQIQEVHAAVGLIMEIVVTAAGQVVEVTETTVVAGVIEHLIGIAMHAAQRDVSAASQLASNAVHQIQHLEEDHQAAIMGVQGVRHLMAAAQAMTCQETRGNAQKIGIVSRVVPKVFLAVGQIVTNVAHPTPMIMVEVNV